MIPWSAPSQPPAGHGCTCQYRSRNAPYPGAIVPFVTPWQYAWIGTVQNMPNSSGTPRRSDRSHANRPDCRAGWYRPIASPEIMKSRPIRQRFIASIGHCSQSCR